MHLFLAMFVDAVYHHVLWKKYENMWIPHVNSPKHMTEIHNKPFENMKISRQKTQQVKINIYREIKLHVKIWKGANKKHEKLKCENKTTSKKKLTTNQKVYLSKAI